MDVAESGTEGSPFDVEVVVKRRILGRALDSEARETPVAGVLGRDQAARGRIGVVVFEVGSVNVLG